MTAQVLHAALSKSQFQATHPKIPGLDINSVQHKGDLAIINATTQHDHVPTSHVLAWDDYVRGNIPGQ